MSRKQIRLALIIFILGVVHSVRPLPLEASNNDADNKSGDVSIHTSPSAMGLTGFLTSLVQSYRNLKIQIQPTLQQWIQEGFNVTETPELIKKRRIIWRQLTEAQFG